MAATARREQVGQAIAAEWYFQHGCISYEDVEAAVEGGRIRLSPGQRFALEHRGDLLAPTPEADVRLGFRVGLRGLKRRPCAGVCMRPEGGVVRVEGGVARGRRAEDGDVAGQSRTPS